MNAHVANVVYDIESRSGSTSPSERLTDGEYTMIEPDFLVEFLTRLDMDLAYSSEKLINLDLFMAFVSLGESELEEMSMEIDSISEEDIEKALIFDLSFGYLDSEVTELGHFLNVLGTNIDDIHQQMHLCRHRREIFDALQEKVDGLESSWSHLQVQLVEMKKQLSTLQIALSVIGRDNTDSLEHVNLEGLGLDLPEAEQQRHVLKMLEKSLAAELDLGKQLIELKEREEALKSKLLLTDNILSYSEAFSDAALERLLEAENSSEIFLGIVKDMISQLQILQFDLRCSVQREGELMSKLSCISQVLSNTEAFSGDVLERLLEAECSSEIYTDIVKEMMSQMKMQQFDLLCSVQREEHLISELLCKNEVASKMEAYSEITLERLLDKEQTSKIFISIAKELMLRLQILQSKLHCSFQREKELKSKLLPTNEAVSDLEAFSEVALERLLEAEHSAEIYMGNAKQMISNLQVLQFNLDCSAQREQELKSKLLITNEVVSNLEAFSETMLERLLEAEHSVEIFMGISKEFMSRLQILQLNLHCSDKKEKEMRSKLLLMNEVVSNLEAFSEVALERLLEAEHSSEVFSGIAKEMMSRLQILQFNLHCSVQRESELKLKLEESLEQLKEKELALTMAESYHAEMKQSFEAKAATTEEKIKALEEKLQSSESKLQETKALYITSQEQVSMMEDAVQSLKEHVFMAESRAHEAEAKLASLTEENIELREEVGFLKEGDANEKISLLEKQVRDLETQLQNAKVASEASLEQQNMLYTAIWDMETLVEELKSKVSKAERKAESAEEECHALAEANLELSEDMSSLKAENDKLKESLKEANRAKVARVKDINNGAKLITEMVIQLASERERIQKQLSSLARENKILMEELKNTRENGAKSKEYNKEDYENKSGCTVDHPAAGISTADSANDEFGETPTSAAASNQMDGPSEENMRDAGASSNFRDCENEAKIKHGNKMFYVFGAALVLMMSIVAMIINSQNEFSTSLVSNKLYG